MKHCSKCNKEYKDSFSNCANDGTRLSLGPYKPWERLQIDSDKNTITAHAISNRYFRYVVLCLLFISITAVSISYSLVRDKIYQAISGVGAKTSTVSPKDAVSSVLTGWASATNVRDLEAHMSYYSDTLSIYYSNTNVSKDTVRSSRAPAFSKYTSLNVQLNNIQITVEPDGNSATATFDKTWDFNGKRHSTGSSQQMVWLSKINGRWLIAGEKDLQIRYANW